MIKVQFSVLDTHITQHVRDKKLGDVDYTIHYQHHDHPIALSHEMGHAILNFDTTTQWRLFISEVQAWVWAIDRYRGRLPRQKIRRWLGSYVRVLPVLQQGDAIAIIDGLLARYDLTT